jgi:hypothetical protein
MLPCITKYNVLFMTTVSSEEKEMTEKLKNDGKDQSEV